MSLYLLFDIGNTRLKWVAVESTQTPSDRQKKLWAYSGSISNTLLASPEHRIELSDYIAKTIPKPDAIGFCCVAGDVVIESLKSLFPQWSDVSWSQLRGDSPYQGLRTLYQEPAKLGADRWAAVIGARALATYNTLIISAGTATTIDLLGANGVHYGGWILPGLGLMHDSLHTNTAQLPLATANPHSTKEMGFGVSTNEAITAGCEAAQLGAIARAMLLAKEMNHPIERIYLDGGNAPVLVKRMSQSPQAHSLVIESIEGLVLRGIWAWLLQNT